MDVSRSLQRAGDEHSKSELETGLEGLERSQDLFLEEHALSVSLESKESCLFRKTTVETGRLSLIFLGGSWSGDFLSW